METMDGPAAGQGGAALLDDADWQKIVERLPALVQARARNGMGTRSFLDAVLFVAVRRVPWASVPEEHGAWHSIYVRFTRWIHEGLWEEVLRALEPNPRLAEPLRQLVGAYRTRYPGRGIRRKPEESVDL